MRTMLVIAALALAPFAGAYEVAGARPGMTAQELKAAGFTKCQKVGDDMACQPGGPISAAIGDLRVTAVAAMLPPPYAKVEEVRIDTSNAQAPKHSRAKTKGQWAGVVPADDLLDRRAEISKVFGPPHPGPWISRYAAGWTDCGQQLAYLRQDGVILLRESGPSVAANCARAAEAKARADAARVKDDVFIRSMKD